MIVERPDPTQLIFQAAAYHVDGTAKTELASAHARIYHVNGVGAEVEDLSSTPMTQVGITNIWRYQWKPVSLAAGQYFAEYTLVDLDSATFVGLEDVVIQDFSLQTDLSILAENTLQIKTDVELIRKVERGRWRIDKLTNQMVFYDEDAVTPLLIFNLADVDGFPSYVNVFERNPV